MIVELLITIAFGLIVGLALGLTGGGGSIFAMPMLIYGIGLSPAEAVPISLVAVGFTAMIGGVQAIRTRLVVWQPTILFALGGIVGAPAGLTVAQLIASQWIVGGFAILSLAAGMAMWLRARRHPEEAEAVRAMPQDATADPVCVLAPDGQLRFTAPCALVLALVGLCTGFLSGLFGVGGGFLIVPALILVTRMGVHGAVGTSLLIISAIGFSGAASALIQGRIDWAILLPFAAGGVAAMLAARQLAGRIAGPVLQQGFSILIILVGIVMLIDSLR